MRPAGTPGVRSLFRRDHPRACHTAGAEPRAVNKAIKSA